MAKGPDPCLYLILNCLRNGHLWFQHFLKFGPIYLSF